VQPPVKGAEYGDYQLTAIRLAFNGKSIDFPFLDKLPQIGAAELNQDFPAAMGNFIDQLNQAINEALIAALGPLGKNRLVLTYKPTLTDPFAILLIEHFVCEIFSLELDYSFSKAGTPTLSFKALTMGYTHEAPALTRLAFNGAILINREMNNKETRVPAFDCGVRDQYTNNDYTKLCEGPDPKPSIIIEPLREGRFQFQGKVENVPASEIVAWVWDFSTGKATEPFYVGVTTEVQLLVPGGTVRLTAITQRGCFGKLDQGINPR
jgi:hypothetical protein